MGDLRDYVDGRLAAVEGYAEELDVGVRLMDAPIDANSQMLLDILRPTWKLTMDTLEALCDIVRHLADEVDSLKR